MDFVTTLLFANGYVGGNVGTVIGVDSWVTRSR